MLVRSAGLWSMGVNVVVRLANCLTIHSQLTPILHHYILNLEEATSDLHHKCVDRQWH